MSPPIFFHILRLLTLFDFSPVKHAKTGQGKNNVVAVFVVQFDVHKGNLVEWQYPEGKILFFLFLFCYYLHCQ